MGLAHRHSYLATVVIVLVLAVTTGVAASLATDASSRLPPRPRLLQVDTIAEAAATARFPIATADLPPNAVRTAISATQQTPDNVWPVEVTQIFAIGDATLLLHQSPSLTSVGGGQRAPLELTDGRHAEIIRYPRGQVAVHWVDDGMGYAVVGILDLGLTERTVVEIANSVRIR